MKVKVDRDLCTGVGNCGAVAPTVFKVDKHNQVVLLDPGSVDDKTLMDAAEACPENAIIIEDDDGNQLYP
ncbi:MAG: ferredoxin [Chloroflexi bacterium]|nr:ferredoxin [Chloroflexota bacterium]